MKENKTRKHKKILEIIVLFVIKYRNIFKNLIRKVRNKEFNND